MSQNEILQGSGKESSISQLFYLDFNGAETSYFNRDLGISIDNVSVSASGFGAQQAATIVNALNTRFSGEAFFTTIRPDEGEYSTVYIGLTSAFDAYGQFLGIAETVDTGNKIHDDNAFVLLDARATMEQVASVIAHEAGHLLGNVEHGGEGLGRYAMETSVANGQVSSSIILQEADYLRVSSGGTAENTTVNECGGVYVYEGGTANSTTVNRWGELYVYEGGTANNTTVNEGGWFEVSSGGTAYGGAISSGGTMWVDGGGTVEEIVVSNGGYVKVLEGAEATGLSIEDGGAFEFVVAPETYVQWTSGGFEYEMEGGLLSEYVLSSGTISVLQDGIVEGITVNAGGELWVYDGGMAMQIIENGGFVWTQDGAEASFDTNTFSGVVLEKHMATVHAETTALDTTINDQGEMSIFEGGSASGVVVNQGGVLEISSGGIATEVMENGGFVWVNEGASATFVPNAVNNLELGLKEGEEPPSLEVYEEKASLHSGTTATSTTLYNCGWLHICEGGVANDTVVSSGGEICVYEGGIANGITANDACWITLKDGATVSGQIDLNGTSVILVQGDVYAEDAEFNFHFDTQTPEDYYLLCFIDQYWYEFDGIGKLLGGSFAITIGPSLDCGVYKFIAGAMDFDVTFAVMDADSQSIGELDVDGAILAYGGFGYYLASDGENITLNVVDAEETDIVPPVITGIAADVTSATNGAVTVTATASDNSGEVTLYYIKDGGLLTVYEDGVVFTANGSVIFKAVDAAGNETVTDEFVVSNIDNVAPVISGIAADVMEPTNGTVKVTASASDDSGEVVLYYSKDSGDFIVYQDGVAFTENGSVVFKAVDAVGNETFSYEFLVTNIDTTMPVISNVAADVTEPTNGAVKVTATASDNSGQVSLYYSKDGGDFTAYENGVAFTENGSVVFKAVDAAGNETVSDAFAVTNIDTVAPVIANVAADVSSATNGAVTVTATASDDSGEVTLYYSKNGGDFTAYQDGVAFSENGKVVFKAVDAAGNETVTDEFVVSNIDNVAPVISGIAADVMEPTNGTVKVTATASDDSGEVALYYSKDGGDFTAYENGVVFTENGKVVFKAVDAVGNETVSEEFAVTNIDTKAPVISTVAADVTEPTNGTVKVTATVSDNSGQVSLYYSKDGGDFTAYENGVAFTENGSVVFKAVDAAGNETVSDAFAVTNIDTVDPVIANVAADVTSATNGAVKVTATASDDSGEVTLYYSKNGGDFTAYQDGVAFSENGKVVFKAVDAAGNETFSDEFLVSNIDSVAPVISDIAADITAPTKGAVTVTATASDDSGEVALYYSKDGGDFTAYENGVVFTENGSLVFKAIDEAGNETLSNVFEVLNIDTVAPVISDIVADVTAPTNGSVKVTATASDNSGQVSLYYSKDGGNFTAYENGVDFTANGSVVFKAVDAAGNETFSNEFQVANIDTVAPAVSSLTIAEPDENGDIAVSIEANEALSQLSYSWNEGEWTDYPEGLLKFNEGGSIRFRLVDLAGNETITDTYPVASSDDWTDMATNGDKSKEIGYFGEAEKGTTKQNEVGKDDLIDYMAITLQCPALLSFTVNSDNKTKFSLLQLQVSSSGKYSLKSIAYGSVTTPGNSIAVTPDKPLGAGTYYICMEATDKKAANAPYTITLNDNSIFYTKADNSDDWTKYDKKRTSNEDNVPDLGTVTTTGTLVEDGWVGCGDSIDYSMFTLDVPVQMVLNVNATDVSKFTLYQLKNNNGKYSLKSMSSNSLKLDKATKQYKITTKKLLLEPGIYYACMQSTNKKKGNAEYSISIDSQSIFCNKADNSDDIPDKKKNTTWAGITADLGTVNAPGMLVEDGWVGFGDASDVAAFTLDTATRVSFDLTASDKSQFVIYKVNDLNTYKCSYLQKTTLKLDKTTGQYAATSKNMLMEAGTYYLYMGSTNASKGGNASYTISLNNNTFFFTNADNSDDLPDKKNKRTWAALTNDLGTITTPGVLVENGWVGYGDVTDVAFFKLEGDASISFDLNSSDATKFVIYKITDMNANKFKTLQTTTLKIDKTSGQYAATSKLLKLNAGTYYVLVASTNASKGNGGNAYYSISVNGNSVLPNTNQQFGAAAPNDNLAIGYLDFQLEDENGGGLVLEGKAENTMASLKNSGEIALQQLATFGGDAPVLANNQVQSGDCLIGISNADEQKYNDGLAMGMLA